MLTSIPDLLIIGGAALLIFGPKRLPELAKSLGKGIREFKKAVDGNEEEKAPETPGFHDAQVLPPAGSTPQQTSQQAATPTGTPTGTPNKD